MPGSRRLGARHFISSVLSFGLSQGVSWLGGALLTIMLPRYLGDVNLGKLGFALALTGLASLAANLGTGTYITKEIARDPSRASELTGRALLIRLPLSLASGAISMGFVTVLGYDWTTRALVGLLTAWILVDAVRGIAQAAIQGLQRMVPLAIIAATSNIVYAIVATALLLHGGGPMQVAFGYLLSQVIAAAGSLLVLLRYARPSLSLRAPGWTTLVAGGLPYFIWQAALVVYGQIDAVLLLVMTNDAVLGWYVAATRVMSIPAFVPVIAGTIMFPALTAARGEPTRFNLMARKALHLTLLLTVPMSLGILLISDRLLEVLDYPPAFHHSVVPIMLLAIGFPMIAADMVLGTALNSLDKQRQWALAGVSSAILNPLANIAAIPFTQAHFGNGAIGAAAVTTATEVFMMVVGLRLLPAGTLDRSVALSTARILLSAALMAAAVVALRSSALALEVVGGVTIYVVGALIFGAITMADLRTICRHLLPWLRVTEGERGAVNQRL